MHWDAENKRRTNCLKGKYEQCSTCDKGVSIIHDYTYGIYTTNGDKTIRYLSTALSSHTNFQQSFKDNLKKNVNPCDILYKVRKGKITTPKGYETVGYEVEIAEDMEAYIAEKDRPSPFQEGNWIIPRIIAEGLTDMDRLPCNLIDLYTEMKERFPSIEEKKIKEYAILIGEGGVVDLRKAKEETW
jgi:hypothetical protein